MENKYTVEQDKEFENRIEVIKMLGSKNCSESPISLVDLAEIVNKLCEEYGRERVMNALRNK